MLYKSAKYYPVTSFTPIAFISRGSPFLIVHPSVPANTLKEFVALIEADSEVHGALVKQLGISLDE